MYPLKVDKKLHHHYIIGVAMHSMRSKNAGKVYLKYGPVHFTNDDVERLQSAIILSDDKLFKTTTEEALRIQNCKDLVSSLVAMRISLSVNSGTMHHFSSEFEIEEEWFENLVDLANKSDVNKELLKKSRKM
jgi:hypothetical protein